MKKQKNYCPTRVQGTIWYLPMETLPSGVYHIHINREHLKLIKL